MIQFILALGASFWLLHKWTAPVSRPKAIPPPEPRREAAPEVQNVSVEGDKELDVEKDVLPPQDAPKAPPSPPVPVPLEINPFRAGQKRQESPYGVRTGSMDDILPTSELEGEEEVDQLAEEDGSEEADDDVEID